VHYAGDAVLADFGSVVAAVDCAVSIQRQLAERNAQVPDGKRLQFRIGVNLGEVIVDRDDIYGDGVNIAARLEGLAEPGGICISGRVYEQVENKLDLGYEYLGEQEVKNIKKPVRVYHVLLEPEAAGTVIGGEIMRPPKAWRWGPKAADPLSAARRTRRPLWRWAMAAAAVAVGVTGGTAIWVLYPREAAPPIEPASLEDMAFPLPGKPSIAVLAFETSRTDPNHQFLAYGLADTIIAELARMPSLFVIAQDSSLRHDYSEITPREVAEQFGVKYVLAGSVIGNDDDLTIDAQLIDAIGGRQLWRQTLEGSTSDLYRIQNEIVNHVRATLEGNPRLEAPAHSDAGFRSRIPRGESYAYLLRGIAHFRNSTPEDNKKAAQLFIKAIELDPGNALAHGWNAWNDVFAVVMGWVKAPEERLQRAFTSAKRSVSLDPSLDFGRWALGATFMTAGDHVNASEQFRQGLDLNPNDPNLLAGAAKSLAFQDVALEAIELGQRALRLNPRPPDWYLWNLGIANYFARRYEDAIAIVEKASNQNTEARLYLIGSYVRSDRKSDAKFQANEINKTDPAFHTARYIDRTLFANPNDKRALVTDLLAAGLPENVSFICMLDPTFENCR
jgi:TolB-like protein/Tfp pilus assembly protein PilF